MKKNKLLKGSAIAAGIFTAVTVWQNVSVKITRYHIYSQNLPTSFNDFRIVLLSDIHSRNFGLGQKALVNRVRKMHPNLILISGDWVDSKHGKLSTCVEQAKLLKQIAPVWAIYGNHEIRKIRKTGVDTMHKALCDAGVHFLHTSGTHIEKENSYINLIGIEDDVQLSERARKKKQIESVKTMLSRVMHGILPDEFTILMAHHPEFIDIYSNEPIDLVVSGHAHGGQVRIPFVGGVIAPNQGLFPRYTSGKHCKNNTQMVISRGIGGFKPVRIFNQPEIVVISLHKGCAKQRKKLVKS